MSAFSPYPGLRPFTEEESIFFKGREMQVERMVKRLEEKKFLMVNGASGDGKSSLVFAGLIPYAKAGFFKAKYNQWLVADFRPERSPLKNLAASLNHKLGLNDVQQTQKELSFGFSALIDLYKNSPCYIDENSHEWQQADEAQRRAMRRKGANLLILADQFEEFFTNPENYHKGNPSIESQQTVNILLETYRLAVAQNIPVYVVCTMRSDYIGQCAAFRGLPEAIGYSQFFVPRLKRQELEQVIEGPAQLAGGKVNKRLVQVLLNSLKDGFDQLPILQHALNRMWKLAGNGKEQLDLIHLAMAGGLAEKYLPASDKEPFTKWLSMLPANKRRFYEHAAIGNILNAHANELLYDFSPTGQQSAEDEKTAELGIIKVLFQSLTQLDRGRIFK
jgi:energy-coupling factor transporter ATP-binding protein EcfA2